MKRRYERPEIEIDIFFSDIVLMSDISREMYEFYRQQFELQCSQWGMEPTEANWRTYVSTLDTDIPYCYHTANMYS